MLRKRHWALKRHKDWRLFNIPRSALSADSELNLNAFSVTSYLYKRHIAKYHTYKSIVSHLRARMPLMNYVRQGVVKSIETHYQLEYNQGE